MSEPTHDALPQRERRKRRTKDTDQPPTDEATNVQHLEDTIEPTGEDTTTTQPKKRPTEKQYEFLDHTADVQVHAWGSNMEEAFENAVLAMFDYMTERDTVDIDPEKTFDVEVSAHDAESLLFTFMDEFLFHFSADLMTIREVSILHFDTENFKIKARGWGELFDLKKHPQGTEVKAITFSNMQIWQKEDFAEVYVIIDI